MTTARISYLSILGCVDWAWRQWKQFAGLRRMRVRPRVWWRSSSSTQPPSESHLLKYSTQILPGCQDFVSSNPVEPRPVCGDAKKTEVASSEPEVAPVWGKGAPLLTGGGRHRRYRRYRRHQHRLVQQALKLYRLPSCAPHHSSELTYRHHSPTSVLLVLF